jgi:hypothetical protein
MLTTEREGGPVPLHTTLIDVCDERVEPPSDHDPNASSNPEPLRPIPLNSSALRIEFVGEVHVLWPGEELTMGRAGELAIDDNPYLHRVVARFSCHQGLWWIHNSGSSIVLHISDRASSSQITVAPGRAVAISFAESIVAFQAGPTNYEVELSVSALANWATAVDLGDATLTIDASRLPFTDDQMLLLIALCERRLRPSPFDQSDLPSNAEVAARMGWRMAQFNRKLDHICTKLSARGVPGLKRVDGRLANDRRRRLVEFAVASQLVTADMLDRLPPPPHR